jgi:plasmid stabilization system protein ParE
MAVHRHYLIFFRILADEIRIERVLHGARDIPAHIQG